MKFVKLTSDNIEIYLNVDQIESVSRMEPPKTSLVLPQGNVVYGTVVRTKTNFQFTVHERPEEILKEFI